MATKVFNVSGSESVGIPREVSSGGIYQMPSDNFTFSLPANVTGIGSYALADAFQSCSSLTSVDLSSLTTVTGSYALSYAFRQCPRLTSLSFPALTTSSFGSYTNQFNGMLNSVRGCTVHFPASIQSTIGGWSSVTGGFGGTNTTVLFDL